MVTLSVGRCSNVVVALSLVGIHPLLAFSLQPDQGFARMLPANRKSVKLERFYGCPKLTEAAALALTA
jgi:hypothetical protein